ncbi:MAG: site-2 protease family protein [Deltaproteobacteria bacterium]|nr:site-2 protease family protein [Deltaproteobacteria bacterium]
MIDAIIRIVVLLFSVTIHEYAHGKAALSLGDPTAKNAGRLTLWPLRHIDPIGAVSLYLFGVGWAKPVPVNTDYFANRRKDTILMAISGPISNLAAAFIAGLCIRFYYMPLDIYLLILTNMVLLNIGLGIFNLLPIPPLDGSHVLENMLPQAAASGFQKIRRYAPIVFLGLLVADHYLKFNIFGRILSYPILFTSRLFAGPRILELLRSFRF